MRVCEWVNSVTWRPRSRTPNIYSQTLFLDAVLYSTKRHVKHVNSQLGFESHSFQAEDANATSATQRAVYMPAQALMVQRRFVCISSEAPQKNITSAVAKFVFAGRPNCWCSLGERAARSLAGRNITRKPRVSESHYDRSAGAIM